MENKENKTTKILVVVIAVLGIIICGMGAYIALSGNSKNANIDNKDKEKNNTKDKTNTKEENSNQKEDSNNNDANEIKPLDLTRCLNDKGYIYSNPKDNQGDYGLSLVINPDQLSVNFNVDWNKYGPMSGASAWTPTVETIPLTGFSKPVVNAFIGDVGQDVTGITLFFILNDGTIEYARANQRGENRKTIPNVSGIVKLYTSAANMPNGNGWVTTLGATKDGSFYDLGQFIQ